MATEIAKAYVQIIPSADGIQGTLTNALDSEANVAGKKAGATISKSLGTAFKATIGTMVGLATATVAVTKSLIDGITEVAEYGDNIDKMSQKMGISAQAYQEWDFILQHCGSSMDALKSSMKTMATAVEKNDDAFRRLGIAQASLRNLSQEEIFARIIKGLQGVKDETERMYLASKLLGRGATELGPLLNMTAEETEQLRQSVHELGGVMSDEAVKASAEFQDNLQDLKVSAQSLKRSFLQDMLPAVSKVMKGLTKIFTGQSGAEEISEGLTDLVEKLINGLPRFLEDLKTIALSIVDVLIDNLPMIFDAGVQIVMELVNAIVENIPKVVEVAFQLVNSLLDTLAEALPRLLPEIAKMINNIFVKVADELPSLIQGIINLLEGLVDGLVEALPILIDAIVNLVVGIVDHLDEIIVPLIKAIPDIISKLIRGIMDNLPKIIEGLITIVVEIVKHLPEIVWGIIQAIPDIIASILEALWGIVDGVLGIFGWIWDGICDIFGAVGEWFADVFSGAYDAICGAFEGIGDFVSSVWDSIKNIFSGVFNWFWNVGKNIVMGIWEGIKSFWSWLTDGISSLWDSLCDGVCWILGINSPSKRFAEMGEYCVQGFAIGTQDIGKDTLDQMHDVMDQIETDAQTGFDMELTSSIGEIGYKMQATDYSRQNEESNDVVDVLNRYLPMLDRNQSVNVYLQGDAGKIFNVVKNENQKMIKSTGIHALA